MNEANGNPNDEDDDLGREELLRAARDRRQTIRLAQKHFALPVAGLLAAIAWFFL